MKSNEENYLAALIFKAKEIDRVTIGNIDDYLNENYNELLDVKTTEYIYQSICQILNGWNVETDSIIKLLIRRYVMFNYDENSPIIKYLNCNSVEEAVLFFKENEFFAIELIVNYYAHVNKKTSDTYGLWYGLYTKFDDSVRFTFISELLRDIFGRFYELMGMVGRGMNIPQSQLFLMTLNEQFVFSGNEEVMEDFEKLKGSFPYLIRLMYADVYEDLVTADLINQTDKKVVQIVKTAIEKGEYKVPSSPFDANLLFGYFAYLAKQRDKRLSNRKNQTLESLNNVKKINPLWGFDDNDIMIKR